MLLNQWLPNIHVYIYAQSAKLVFSNKFDSYTVHTIPIQSTQFPYSPRNSPGQNAGVGSLSLLQGIFPDQGSNPDLPHCRRILYQLRHKGSPGIWDCISFHHLERFIEENNTLKSGLILWMKIYWKINSCHSKSVFHCLHFWAIGHNALRNTWFLYSAWKSFPATSPTIF